MSVPDPQTGLVMHAVLDYRLIPIEGLKSFDEKLGLGLEIGVMCLRKAALTATKKQAGYIFDQGVRAVGGKACSGTTAGGREPYLTA